jgi:hypothetical protein
MPIDTKHSEYEKFSTRWDEMEDALDEQDTIRKKRETYLKATSGMIDDNYANYESYINRARFPGITRKALTGIIGLLFEKDPEGLTEDIVTRSGQTSLELAREVTRSVAAYGRSVLVVDAPKRNEDGSGGGKPYIARYHPKKLINWKVNPDNTSELLLAVFEEDQPVENSEDQYVHDTVKRFRRYTKVNGVVELAVLDKEGKVVEGPHSIAGDTIPVFTIGSIDTNPGCDPVPLLPVKDCAVSIYNVSADLRQDLYSSGQKQQTMSGVTRDQYEANTKLGYGAGGVWYMGQEGKAELLESTGTAYESAAAERMYEHEEASKYAVELATKSDSAESGRALEIRAATQHASIFTMADSISIGLTAAMAFAAKWNGSPEPLPFVLKTEFSGGSITGQDITALSTGVMQRTVPQSVLNRALRLAGYTELTDKEMKDEIDTGGGNLLQPPPDGADE